MGKQKTKLTLTPSQNDLMTYLNKVKKDGKVIKKYQEITDERGITTISAVRRMIPVLESKGWIKREWEGSGKNSDGTPRLMTIKIL